MLFTLNIHALFLRKRLCILSITMLLKSCGAIWAGQPNWGKTIDTEVQP